MYSPEHIFYFLLLLLYAFVGVFYGHHTLYTRTKHLNTYVLYSVIRSSMSVRRRRVKYFYISFCRNIS